MKKNEKELREYRRQKFQVRVTPARYPDEPGEVALSITHNRRQWYVWHLTHSERVKVIAALLLVDEIKKEGKG